MLTLLTKPLSEYKVLGEQEAKTKLGKLSEELVKNCLNFNIKKNMTK